jgi:hypothetical protein
VEKLTNGAFEMETLLPANVTIPHSESKTAVYCDGYVTPAYINFSTKPLCNGQGTSMPMGVEKKECGALCSQVDAYVLPNLAATSGSILRISISEGGLPFQEVQEFEDSIFQFSFAFT